MNKLYPKIIAIDLTSRCNLSCIMCHARVNKMPIIDMPLETWNMIREEMLPNIRHLLMGSTGESFLYPHFDVVINDLTKFPDLFTEISTNGLLLNNQRIFDLTIGNIKQLIVSIDAATPSLYKEIRRGGNIETLIDNITKIKEYNKIHEKKTTVVFRVVVMRKNLIDIPKIFHLAKQLDISCVEIKNMDAPSSEFNDENVINHPSEWNEIYDEICNINKYNEFNICFPFQKL